jgi:hypothetical protein
VSPLIATKSRIEIVSLSTDHVEKKSPGICHVLATAHQFQVNELPPLTDGVPAVDLP